MNENLSRRDLIKFASKAILTAEVLYQAPWLLGCNDDKGKSQAALPGQSVLTPLTVVDEPDQFIDGPYIDPLTNLVAQEKGISAGDFFIVPERLVSRMEAFRGDHLYRIYPPAVQERDELINILSKEFNLPKNVVAIIMSIESCGYQFAGSPAAAIGLFQPLQDKFPDWVRSEKNADRKQELMFDPLINGRAGMGYLKDYAIPAAIRENGFSEKDVRTYVRGLISYNGGPGLAGLDHHLLWTESQVYGDHFIRFALDCEMAEGLKTKGVPDDQIRKRLLSPAIDARAFALRVYVTEGNPNYEYGELEQVLRELSLPEPGTGHPKNLDRGVAPFIGNAYKQYFTSRKEELNPVYRLPMSAGVRTWLGHTFDNYLFASDPRNMDPQRWL